MHQTVLCFWLQIPVLGSETTGHYRPRLGAGSLLTCSVRIVSDGASRGMVSAGPGREMLPHENGRSTFYIDPAAYNSDAQSTSNESQSGTALRKPKSVSGDATLSEEDAGLSLEEEEELVLPSVAGIANPAMALTRFVQRLNHFYLSSRLKKESAACLTFLKSSLPALCFVLPVILNTQHAFHRSWVSGWFIQCFSSAVSDLLLFNNVQFCTQR